MVKPTQGAKETEVLDQDFLEAKSVHKQLLQQINAETDNAKKQILQTQADVMFKALYKFREVKQEFEHVKKFISRYENDIASVRSHTFFPWLNKDYRTAQMEHKEYLKERPVVAVKYQKELEVLKQTCDTVKQHPQVAEVLKESPVSQTKMQGQLYVKQLAALGQDAKLHPPITPIPTSSAHALTVQKEKGMEYQPYRHR